MCVPCGYLEIRGVSAYIKTNLVETAYTLRYKSVLSLYVIIPVNQAAILVHLVQISR